MVLDNEKSRELLEQLLAEKAGIGVAKVKVRDLELKFLTEHGRLSPDTIHNYKWAFDRLAAVREWWFESSSEVNEFIGSLGVLKDESVRTIYGLLRAVSRYCKKTYGWNDVFENATRPNVQHRTRRYLKPTEFTALAGACKSVEDKVLVYSLMDTTCRIKELAGLRVENLRADAVVTMGKTGQRVYRCDARLLEMMRGIAVDGVVFPLQDDSRRIIRPAVSCSGKTLAARFRNIMKRGGLSGEKLGPHTLRHTGASLIARSTRSPLAVKALLQQDDIKSAMLYIHDVEEEIAKEISPLALAGVNLDTGKVKVLELEALGDSGEVEVDLIPEFFPAVPEGLFVRPGLKSDDLELMRDMAILYMRVNKLSGAGSPPVVLMRRILSKVK